MELARSLWNQNEECCEPRLAGQSQTTYGERPCQKQEAREREKGRWCKAGTADRGATGRAARRRAGHGSHGTVTDR